MTRYALLALLIFTGSCAVPPPEPQTSSLRPAFDRLVVDASTKANALAALGRSTVVDFDSGYEVWVYREQLKEQPPAEFVLLFDPSGVLKKKRRNRKETGTDPISVKWGLSPFQAQAACACFAL